MKDIIMRSRGIGRSYLNAEYFMKIKIFKRKNKINKIYAETRKI